MGFEPTDAFTSPVFKTGALDHSATLPEKGNYTGSSTLCASLCGMCLIEVCQICVSRFMKVTDEVDPADGRMSRRCMQTGGIFRSAKIIWSAIVRKTPVSCHAFDVIFPEEGASSFFAELLNCAL